MLSSIFSTFSFIIRIYSYLCIAYILLSWLSPNARGGFLDEVCGPYLYWFRRFKFTQIGMLDFSPILALGALQLIAQFFYQLALTKTFSPIGLVIGIISIIWSFFSFILNFLIIILIFRLILDFSENYRAGNITEMIDRFLTPVFAKFHRLFSGKLRSLREQLIISLVVLIIIRLLLGTLVGSGTMLFRGFKVL